MASKTNIVVSRYNKNVDFVYKINNGKNINVLIYDKENPNNPLNIPVNKGNEASVYLKYIIDNKSKRKLPLRDTFNGNSPTKGEISKLLSDTLTFQYSNTKIYSNTVGSYFMYDNNLIFSNNTKEILRFDNNGNIG